VLEHKFISINRAQSLQLNTEITMNKFLSTLTAASIALAVIAPVASTSAYAGGGIAKIEKKCHKFAKKQARRATNGNVIASTLVGGIAGGLLGSAIGGKKTTIGMAAGGAALGMVSGATSYDEAYDYYFNGCMDDHLN
jgi:uncharacterized protein YcfJ